MYVNSLMHQPDEASALQKMHQFQASSKFSQGIPRNFDIRT